MHIFEASLARVQNLKLAKMRGTMEEHSVARHSLQ